MKPILFNTDMVRAILSGQKTQTRRVVKPRFGGSLEVHEDVAGTPRLCEKCGTLCRGLKPPCRSGDILYVRETWATDADGEYVYRTNYGTTEDDLFPPSMFKWRPSIHMPKEAARIFLRVTAVRVERLGDITVEGILSEGINVEMPPICIQATDPNYPSEEQRQRYLKMTPEQQDQFVQTEARHTYMGWCKYVDNLKAEMERIWDSTIKLADLDRYGWDANPWVCVIEFERCEKPQEDKP